jgi:serine/threonine protein kinase
MKHMRFYLAEIVAGVHFLHSRNILYGDLKLDNIMIDGEGHVRLVDFNMSVLGVSAGCKSVHGPRGSKYSQAPEQVRGAAYGLKTDVWALGCVAFEMFLKTHVSKSSLEEFAANELTTTDPVVDDFIKCLLVRDADARPSMEDVKKHELFQAVEWADVEQKRLPVPWMPPDDCFHFDKELQELDPFPLFEDVNKLRFVVVPRME